jgi:hypothetical protein
MCFPRDSLDPTTCMQVRYERILLRSSVVSYWSFFLNTNAGPSAGTRIRYSSLIRRFEIVANSMSVMQQSIIARLTAMPLEVHVINPVPIQGFVRCALATGVSPASLTHTGNNGRLAVIAAFSSQCGTSFAGGATCPRGFECLIKRS